jgi:hypothetical protein
VGFNAEIMTADFALQDLTADKAWLEQALARFRTHIVPVWKQLGPFLHDPYNQIRSQDYWQEDAQYFLNIPVFCELHRRTGDEAVLKMLQEACDQPLPHSFDDAALYATALYAYVGMATKNQELLGKAMNSFIEGFPLSKCPPVFLPGNYTWPADSAGMLRSGEILQYAAWKTRPGK